MSTSSTSAWKKYSHEKENTKKTNAQTTTVVSALFFL